MKKSQVNYPGHFIFIRYPDSAHLIYIKNLSDSELLILSKHIRLNSIYNRSK